VGDAGLLRVLATAGPASHRPPTKGEAVSETHRCAHDLEARHCPLCPPPGGPDVSAPRFCQSCGTDRAIIFTQAKEALLAAERKRIAVLLDAAYQEEGGNRTWAKLHAIRDSLLRGELPE
jgi:hypothetical protein